MGDFLDPIYANATLGRDKKPIIESVIDPSDTEISYVANVVADFLRYKVFRNGEMRQMKFLSLEEVWRQSRELFWNAQITASEDLAELGLQFALPFTRKEVMDLTGRMTSLGINPTIHGDNLDEYGLKVLNGMYQHWRFKTNDKVEKFWQLLYGFVNGTVCNYVGFNSEKKKYHKLTSYDPAKGTYNIEETDVKWWNDVESYTVPIEDIYLPKIYERNIQKQGKVIWRSQMDVADFHREFGMWPKHKLVLPGNRISEDSLYYRLLGGTGVTTFDKIEVFRVYDIDNDQFGIVASGIHLNPLGSKANGNYRVAPMPFDHKMLPFAWGIGEALDEKLAYGMPTPFKIKQSDKLLNMMWTFLMERELRTIDPPILTSEIEARPIIFGQKGVIPVQDINGYKEMEIKPTSNDYFTTLNSSQSLMTGFAQGGLSQGIASIQPKSAAEVDSVNQQKQQLMSTTFLMYYDFIRQETMLALKTMLQYYPVSKYNDQKAGIIKALIVPNMPLSLGGQGDLEIRLVDKVKRPLDLFFEDIKKSIQNGRMSQTIEIDKDALRNLDFTVTQIDLEQEQTSEMKKAMYIQTVIQPMLQNYVPMGIADPGKVFLRHMEELGESPSDFASSKILPQLMASWGSGYMANNLVPQNHPQVGPQQMGGMAQPTTPMGALQQANNGANNGALSRGGQGMTPMNGPQQAPAVNAMSNLIPQGQ